MRSFNLLPSSGLMVRDARLRRALTMRVQEVLILRSPPQAGVSKDAPSNHPPRHDDFLILKLLR
jgi:hypothetical protein